MIYAEVRKLDHDDGSYSLMYLVHNDDMIGAYRTDYNRYGEIRGIASRDYHKLATEQDIEAYRAYQAWVDNDCEGEYPPHYGGTLNEDCIWHDGKPCLCDGSYVVEVTADDKKAYMIAAMMAGVKR